MSDRPSPPHPVAADAVIVNWNGRAYLPSCLAALRRSTVPLRLIVVDNASEDGSARYLREEHPDVLLVASAENLGYAGGANAGLAAGDAEFAIVMNPDVALAPDHVEVLRDRFLADASLGAAQGKLYQVSPAGFAEGRWEPGGILDSAGHAISRTRMVVDRGQGEPDDPRFSVEEPVFSACGAALFLRRAMLDDVAPGGEYFDPDFFAYKEDIDLCWRARLLGWEIRYVPSAIGYHVRTWGGKRPPSDTLSVFARRHSWKNHYLLLVKNESLRSLAASLPAVVGWEILRQGHALLRDRSVYRSYRDLLDGLPRALRRRQEVMRRRRKAPHEVARWTRGTPRP